MAESEIEYKNIFSPPGGILIWLFIVLEILTFTMGIVAFSFQRMSHLQLFNSSREMLDISMGTLNTIVLLTSGFLMAEAVRTLKQEGDGRKSNVFMLGTIALGVAFLLLKSIEYSSKIDQGIGLEYNRFFTFYWLLTGFHFVHVVIGLAILSFLYPRVRAGLYTSGNCFDVESGAAFWHMCDLIWLLLFPVMYLLR